MSRLLHVLLGSILFFSSICAMDIQSLADALLDVEPGDLVVLDIDETLLMATEMVGFTDWGHHVTQKLVDSGMPVDAAMTESTRRLMEAHRRVQVQLIEASTADWIEALQDRGITVIGLTSRPAEFSVDTSWELATLGIHLARSAPALEDFHLPVGEPTPKYSEGILFTYRINKGKTLAKFLEMAELNPTRVIFIDDSESNTVRVQEAMQKLGICCRVFHYTGASERRATFDPEIADRQWEALESLSPSLSEAA